MSWNRIILTILLTFSVFSQSVFSQNKIPMAEDELIVRGLLYEEYEAYENSYQVYKRLFDDTRAEVYLFKEATSSLMGNVHIVESIDQLNLWNEKYPEKLEIRRLLIPLYLSNRQVDKAKEEAEFLLEKSKLPIDMDLASNSFLYAGDFKRALNLLASVYKYQPKESTLLRMAEIMDEFTNERKKAIQLLETHRRMNVSSQDIYYELLLLYKKEKDIEGVLETYKAMYKIDNQELYLSKIIDIYMYKKDMNSAILLLEKSKYKKELLYELYKTKRYFAKALKLLDILYSEKNNPKWLAEKGVLLFENAKDKNDKKMIDKVISQFQNAIAMGNDDSIYLNYYGYTLIDKEVDVEKGIKIIEDALAQQPDNTYYMDSLAWGYYKENECLRAYDVMKRVVEAEGLKEKEIVRHWDAIQKCK